MCSVAVFDLVMPRNVIEKNVAYSLTTTKTMPVMTFGFFGTCIEILLNDPFFLKDRVALIFNLCRNELTYECCCECNILFSTYQS